MDIKQLWGMAFSIMISISILASVSSMLIASAQIPGIPPGVPRGDVYITLNNLGRFIDPYQCNPFAPGATACAGLEHIGGNFLWYFNTTTGELIPWVASTYPEYSPDYKTMKVYIRKGVMWSDGVPYTADDLVFQVNLLKNNSKLSWHATIDKWVDYVYKEDDYTVVFKLKAPNPRFHYFFTAELGMELIAKHVWENVKDPITFKNYPPLTLGPYVLRDVDPNGYWFLWERKDDWWGAIKYGIKPGPKYVLLITYGTVDKNALALQRFEMDSTTISIPEVIETILKNPDAAKWIAGFYGRKTPWAWPYDACMKGVAPNLLRYPYNITEVRWALTHAINIKEIIEAFTGPDGSKPIASPLPIVPRPETVKVYIKPLEPELIKLGYDPDTGWWKYDPALSERLLQSVGFYRGSDGKWRLPDGTPWVIRIMTYTTGGSGVMERLAYVTADQWRKFGIDVKVDSIELSVYTPRLLKGDFDVAAYYPGCNFLPVDLGDVITRWHSRYADPDNPGLGWLYYSNFALYNFSRRAELDEVLQQLDMTPPQDPNAIELAKKALLIWAETLPWILYSPFLFYTLNNRYVWEGFPEYPNNYYSDPVWWWPHLLLILLQLRPTGNVPIKEAYTPTKFQLPPLEQPVATTKPTGTVSQPGIITSVSTITMRETVKVPTTITATTAPASANEMNSAVITGILAFIVGLAIGLLIRRRRG